MKSVSAAEAEALEEAAWDVFLSEAPKKEGQNDLTYIPVNEKTLRRKNGDLMILYHLLPEIAVEAWEKIHEETYFAHGRASGPGCKIVIRGHKVRNKTAFSEEETADDPSHCPVQNQG